MHLRSTIPLVWEAEPRVYTHRATDFLARGNGTHVETCLDFFVLAYKFLVYAGTKPMSHDDIEYHHNSYQGACCIQASWFAERKFRINWPPCLTRCL